MSCTLCDFTLKEKDRMISADSFFGEENCWIECDDNSYNLIVEYDCGYAAQRINDIKYCPMCGRKLSNE